MLLKLMHFFFHIPTRIRGMQVKARDYKRSSHSHDQGLDAGSFDHERSALALPSYPTLTN